MTDVKVWTSSLTGTVSLKWTTCISCGTVIAMVDEMFDRRQKTGETFYCPNGHSQHFIVGETKADRFKRLMENERARADMWRDQAEAAERSKRAVRGHLTRIRRRIANGVCPCCTRTFQNVERHMENQHPDYVTDWKRKEEAVSD
jgi:hypothetical protein